MFLKTLSPGKTFYLGFCRMSWDGIGSRLRPEPKRTRHEQTPGLRVMLHAAEMMHIMNDTLPSLR